jgi:hypothetical protein
MFHKILLTSSYKDYPSQGIVLDFNRRPNGSQLVFSVTFILFFLYRFQNFIFIPLF